MISKSIILCLCFVMVLPKCYFIYIPLYSIIFCSYSAILRFIDCLFFRVILPMLPFTFIDIYCLEEKVTISVISCQFLKQILACIFQNFYLIICIEESDDLNNFTKNFAHILNFGLYCPYYILFYSFSIHILFIILFIIHFLSYFMKETFLGSFVLFARIIQITLEQYQNATLLTHFMPLISFDAP